MLNLAKLKSVKMLGILVAGVAFSVLACGSVRAANVITDFSATNNGTSGNAWSYGYYSSGTLSPSSFVKFPDERSVPGYTQLDEWYTSGTTDPNVIYNPGSDVNTGSNFGTIDFQPSSINLGPAGGPAVVEYMVPTAGTYDISAAFRTVQVGNIAPTAYVYIDGVQKYEQQLSDPPNDPNPNNTDDQQFGIISSYNKDWLLPQNATIDFVVFGNISNNKTTQLIASVTAVPLPQAMLGSALLLGCLAAFRLVGRKPFAG